MSTTTRIKDNFDINIYNRGKHEDPTGDVDLWVLCPYSIEEEFEGYGTGTELSDLNLVLRPSEAKALTLGWGPELGGDYIEDEDFWLDKDTFLDTYKDIPYFVKVWIDLVLAVL